MYREFGMKHFWLPCMISDEEATSAVLNFLHRMLEAKDACNPTHDKAILCEESPSEIEVIAWLTKCDLYSYFYYVYSKPMTATSLLVKKMTLFLFCKIVPREFSNSRV